MIKLTILLLLFSCGINHNVTGGVNPIVIEPIRLELTVNANLIASIDKIMDICDKFQTPKEIQACKEIGLTNLFSSYGL